MTDRTYLRISLDTAASGSIDKQRAMLAPHLRADAAEYVDRSVSGSKIPFAERPAGAQLLADLQKGDRLLVTKIDRAARNTEDLLALVTRVNAAGAEVVFAEPYINTEGPIGKLMLTLLGAVAEFEASLIAERRRDSLVAFAAEGRHAVGRAPFGLVSAENPRGRGLVLRPDPENAPRLRAAVADLIAGSASQNECARRLGLGAPTFSRLLRNERLAGVTSNGEVDPDAGVFSLLEWDELQRHLQRPEKTWTRSEDYGPALTCGVCGDRLYFQKAANPAHSTYKCRGVNHATPGGTASIMRANADSVIETDFLAAFGRMEVMERVTTSSSDARARALATARLHLTQAKAALDAAEDDDAEADAFKAYRRAKKALTAAEDLPDETVTDLIPTGESFREAWDRSTASERIDMVLASGIRYVVEPGRLPLAEKLRRSESAEQDYLAGQND